MPIKIFPLLLAALLVCLMCVQSVKAAVIHDLYDASIAVDNQSLQAQNKAFSLAFKEVLIKVRGNNDLLSNPKIKNAVTKATRFVRSYSYDMQGSQLYLVINFDSHRVENIIRSSGFPVWDKRRPDSIVWLAIKSAEHSTREMVSKAKYSAIYQRLRERAAQRGITLMLPLWDLIDIQALSVYDIWGSFSAQISAASERYAVPSILSARVYVDTQLSDPVQGHKLKTKRLLADWTLIEGGDLLSGQIQGDNPLTIAEALIDSLADQLSLKYAVDVSQINRADTKVEIVVNNIDSITLYKQALTALENMSVVNGATLITLQGQRATFELDLLGDVEDLTNALSLDSEIRPVVDDFGQPILGLEFFWVR